MRLWHKDLLGVLPRQQLLSQWRECCCIAKNAKVNNTPNHILVNKILEYDYAEFCAYSLLVVKEFKKRGYKIDKTRFTQHVDRESLLSSLTICKESIFEGWHNDRYFWQCCLNLQEKYDCGGIPEEEWENLRKFAKIYLQDVKALI